MRYGGDVAVAEQWKNRMIKGRSGDLDLPGLRQLPVFRNDHGADFALLAPHPGLVFKVEIPPLFHQPPDFRIVLQKLLVEPRQLG